MLVARLFALEAPAEAADKGCMNLNSACCVVDPADARDGQRPRQSDFVKGSFTKKLRSELGANLCDASSKYIACCTKDAGQMHVIALASADKHRPRTRSKADVLDLSISEVQHTSVLVCADSDARASLFPLHSSARAGPGQSITPFELRFGSAADERPRRVLSHPRHAASMFTVHKSHIYLWDTEKLRARGVNTRDVAVTCQEHIVSVDLTQKAHLDLGVRLCLPTDSDILDFVVSCDGQFAVALAGEGTEAVVWALPFGPAPVLGEDGVIPASQVVDLSGATDARGGFRSCQVLGDIKALDGSPRGIGAKQVFVALSACGSHLVALPLSQIRTGPLGQIMQSIRFRVPDRSTTDESPVCRMRVGGKNREILVLASSHDLSMLVLPLATNWPSKDGCPFSHVQVFPVEEPGHQIAVTVNKSSSTSRSAVFIFRMLQSQDEKSQVWRNMLVTNELAYGEEISRMPSHAPSLPSAAAAALSSSSAAGSSVNELLSPPLGPTTNGALDYPSSCDDRGPHLNGASGPHKRTSACAGAPEPPPLNGHHGGGWDGAAGSFKSSPPPPPTASTKASERKDRIAPVGSSGVARAPKHIRVKGPPPHLSGGLHASKLHSPEPSDDDFRTSLGVSTQAGDPESLPADGRRNSAPAVASGASASAAAASAAAQAGEGPTSKHTRQSIKITGRGETTSGRIKEAAASLVMGLDKRRTDEANRIVAYVVDLVKPKDDVGEGVMDLEKLQQSLEKAIEKVREARHAQAYSERGVHAAVSNACDSWVEQSRPGIHSLLQQEFERASGDLSSSIAQRVAQSSELGSALARGIHRWNAGIGRHRRQPGEDVRQSGEIETVVVSTLTDSLQESLVPLIETELSQSIRDKLVPALRQQVNQIMASMKDQVRECVNEITKSNEVDAKEFGKAMAPLISEELQVIQRSIRGLTPNAEFDQGSAGASESQIAMLVDVVRKDMVAPLQAQIRSLHAEADSLRKQLGERRPPRAAGSEQCRTSAQPAAPGPSSTAEREAMKAQRLCDEFKAGSVARAMSDALCLQEVASHEDFVGRLLGTIEQPAFEWLDEGPHEAGCPLSQELLHTLLLTLSSQVGSNAYSEEALETKLHWMYEILTILNLSDPSIVQQSLQTCLNVQEALGKIEGSEPATLIRRVSKEVKKTAKLLEDLQGCGGSTLGRPLAGAGG